MPDIPFELSAATLPAPVLIALALVIVVVPACMYVRRRLLSDAATWQTPAEIREASIIGRSLVYLAASILAVAFMVSLIFISILA